MKHDHLSFAPVLRAAGAYREDAAERIRRFVPMVRRLAWHVHGGGRPGIELEDLMQAGMVALTEAAQRHAGPGEDGFAAYAKLRVRGAMVDLVRRAVPLSRGIGARRRLLQEAEARLRAVLGRAPHGEELATALEISPAELASLRDASAPVRIESLDDAYTDSDAAFADDGPDAFAMLAESELREALIAAVTALPERLQLVVQLYFVEELNLSEIAEIIGVSVPRIHQLKAQALERLRAALAGQVVII